MALAVADATVVLDCRNIGKAGSAVASITASVPFANVKFLKLDLADLAPVEVFAANFRGEHDHLACWSTMSSRWPLTRPVPLTGSRLSSESIILVTSPRRHLCCRPCLRLPVPALLQCEHGGADTAVGRPTTRASWRTCCASWSCSDVSLRRVEELSLWRPIRGGPHESRYPGTRRQQPVEPRRPFPSPDDRHLGRCRCCVPLQTPPWRAGSSTGLAGALLATPFWRLRAGRLETAPRRAHSGPAPVSWTRGHRWS